MDTTNRINEIMDHYHDKTQESWTKSKWLISSLLEKLEIQSAEMLDEIEFNRISLNMDLNEQDLRNLNMKISSLRQLTDTIKTLQSLRRDMTYFKNKRK